MYVGSTSEKNRVSLKNSFFTKIIKTANQKQLPCPTLQSLSF